MVLFAFVVEKLLIGAFVVEVLLIGSGEATDAGLSRVPCKMPLGSMMPLGSFFRVGTASSLSLFILFASVALCHRSALC